MTVVEEHLLALIVVGSWLVQSIDGKATVDRLGLELVRFA
jgi:hypothetical protein